MVEDRAHAQHRCHLRAARRRRPSRRRSHLARRRRCRSCAHADERDRRGALHLKGERRVVVLGHRGGRGEGWPEENGLEAFARALAEGAEGVELDVRLTADGVPVLVHDPALADGRLVGAVKRADLPPAIATLGDALDALRGKIVNVELKGDLRPGTVTLDAAARISLARTAARAVADARGVEVVFSSFDPTIVLALAAIAPRVERAILVGPRTPRAAMPLVLGMRPAVHAAHLEDSLVTRERVQRLLAARLRVCAWTVNDEARADELVRWGVDWLITDRPAAITRRR
ncbi:MAG: glycerophosphodiester phosphodiesterase [Deltaproteobacteria bacterium]|nr:glycerophosphodiester phosphodiesterase [Deltaproteobacteria bacterium]